VAVRKMTCQWEHFEEDKKAVIQIIDAGGEEVL
jgi:hypothetical protein